MSLLEVSLYVFTYNYLQLKKLLDTYKDKVKMLTLWSNPPIQDRFHLEATRLLHNYVASAKSLAEHSRTIYREKYGSESWFAEYQPEVDRRFTNNPLVQFVEDLREYSLHYKQLIVISDWEWVKSPPKDESRFVLHLESLIKAKFNWSFLSREYLRSQTKDIDVTDLMEKYYTLVIEFHKWIRSKNPLIVHKEQ